MNKRHADNKKRKRNDSGDILGIAIIAVSAFFLLCICVPIILGPISAAIKGAVLGVFGLFSYPMFLGLLLCGIALVRDLSLQLSLRNKICIAVIAFCAILILQLATSYMYIDGKLGFTHYISEVYSNITAGGVLFGVFAYGLQFAVTQIFAYIILSTGIIISLLVMFNVFGRVTGKRQKNVPQEVSQKASFEKSDRPAKMVRPIENNGLFVGTIVKNNSAVSTGGGSFSDLKPSQQTLRDIRDYGKNSDERTFESYDSVREKYGVASPETNIKANPDRDKNKMFEGYNGSEKKPTPHEILFGNKTAQYRNYLNQNFDSSVLNAGGYATDNSGAYNPLGTYGLHAGTGSVGGVVTPTPTVGEPIIKQSALPPKYVHRDSGVLGYEVVMPAPKDISADIVGGDIMDGEAISQKLAEEKGVASRVENSSDAATFNFDTKKVQPTSFKPIEKLLSPEKISDDEKEQNIAPIINGDYYRSKSDETATTSRTEKPENLYTKDYADMKVTSQSYEKQYEASKTEESLPPIINGEDSSSYHSSLEELIKQDKAIGEKKYSEKSESADPYSDSLYFTTTFESDNDSLKEDEKISGKRQSAFDYSDEIEDLSEKTFDSGKDNTGYYQTVDDYVPPVVEIPKQVKPTPLKPQNQMRIEEVLAGQPEEKPQPKPKKKHARYIPPPLDLLVCNSTDPAIFSGNAEEKAKILEDTLESLKLPAKVTAITNGPAVTRYELEIPTGTSVRKIDMYSSDIEYNLASNGKIRIETPIPGKRAVGIEVPNSEIATVALRDLIGCKEFQSASSPVTLAIGKDIAGSNIICNLEKMPHLLIAGATNSGKSACLNSIIASILYKASPDEVRMILIDPKEVEFRIYRDMPHLLMKEIINDTDQAIRAFKWAKNEMDRRYKLLSRYCARNIQEFNSGTYVKDGLEEKLPRIVIVVDELCELMMSVNRKDLEDKIMSMAQKARAAGIHLILATQRPSVDVITGTIKANLPSRIAFAVASVNDSRTILDQGGAESLLGRGDMLYAPADMPQPKRVQGAYITSAEVESVVNFVKEHNTSDYDSDVEGAIMTPEPAAGDNGGSSDDDEEFDPLIKDVLRRVIETGQASTSMIQRRFSVGYARASRIIDQMEMHHFIGPLEGSNKPREVFITAEQFREIFGEDL